jgi:hypothetical protein
VGKLHFVAYVSEQSRQNIPLGLTTLPFHPPRI